MYNSLAYNYSNPIDAGKILNYEYKSLSTGQ
jgi:hypothetical protein